MRANLIFTSHHNIFNWNNKKENGACNAITATCHPIRCCFRLPHPMQVGSEPGAETCLWLSFFCRYFLFFAFFGVRGEIRELEGEKRVVSVRTVCINGIIFHSLHVSLNHTQTLISGSWILNSWSWFCPFDNKANYMIWWQKKVM